MPLTEPPEHAWEAPIAVVTGASSGIGRAVAWKLALRGWRTCLLARRERLLRSLAKELSAHAPSEAIRVDLSQRGAAEAAAAQILAEHGRIDALVNNAGFGIYEPFLEQGPDDHRRLMEVNYFSPLSLVRAFLPSMLERGQGLVVNVASMSAKMGPWGHSGYAASKAALRALSETLEAECAPRGVRFACVFPGIVDTPYFERGGMRRLFARLRGRAISAERCAEAICGVIDRPRVWVCVPWHYRLLDAMSAFSPRLAHAIVARSSTEAASGDALRPVTAPGSPSGR